MNLKNMIIKAVETQNATLAGRLVDHCRYQLGMKYSEIFALANQLTGVELGDWDALLMEYEEAQEARYV